jgi:signal transduction histidine kinase
MDNDRARTDKSLSNERKDSDRVLHDARMAEVAADAVIEAARLKADAVLVLAREKADEATRPSQPLGQAIVDEDRARADALLEVQRTTADDQSRRDREAERLALARLLPLEREHTDRDLLTERGRSDDAIANRDGFLAIVSHDLRILLRGIAFSSVPLTNGPVHTEEGRRVVETGNRIQHFAARMNCLISDLVDVMSIDAGQMSCAIAPADPRAVITETVAAFHDSAARKGITLETDVRDSLSSAAFDHDRILQVLANLVSNALKFTKRGGRVCVRGQGQDDQIHFSVADTGPGIPQSMLESVFVRFWQTSANDPRGSGLGLYIARSIVEAHGGRIWAVSKIGEGSVFHVTLPVVTASGL